MPRLTKLNDVLFPVEEHPVFVSLADKGGERRLAVPEKKAIVNRTTHHVLGIVSRGYRLVSNAEALDLAPASIGPLLVRAEREFEKRYRALGQEELR